jgi:hypothetical protein
MLWQVSAVTSVEEFLAVSDFLTEANDQKGGATKKFGRFLKRKSSNYAD